MDAWNPIYTTQMANNFVKWWRTKFLNGYKQFSVECSDGRISDTEELLGSVTFDEERTERLRAACTTPPLQTQNLHPVTNSHSPQPSQNSSHHHLNLEEFSCDVSVEGGLDKSGQERQEFSFTLYDFDGHGKITKDDIAGLVTTIYEALGSSVKVPHYGSKTIKVKLTVSPDQRKHVSATVIDSKENKTEQRQQDNVRYKKDLNVTIKHAADDNKKKQCHKQKQKETEQRRHYCCRKLDEERDDDASAEDCSDVCSRISGDISSDDEEGECSEDQLTKCKRYRPKRYQKTANAKYQTNLYQKEFNNQDVTRTKKVKKRSSSLQRQDLLKIIQANMDKNNLSFQTARKPNANHISLPNESPQSELKHRHRHKAVRLQATPFQHIANMMDPTHFYVDLAALHNTTQVPQTNCQYDKLLDAMMCISSKKIAKNQTCRRHYRSKSHDLTNLPIRYQLLEHPTVENLINNNGNIKNAKKTVKKINEFDQNSMKKNIKKFPQVVLGHTSSPHHLRHRNRQEDQARAMAQVVRWLEQEFSSNLHTNDNKKEDATCWSSTQEKHSSTPATPGNGVERHEHHHVHEHIHHHYHHYQETPVVV